MSADTQIRQLRDADDKAAQRIRCRAGEHWQEPISFHGLARNLLNPWHSALVTLRCPCSARSSEQWGPWDLTGLPLDAERFRFRVT